MGILDEVANESQQTNQPTQESQPTPQSQQAQTTQGPSLLDQVATESQPTPPQPSPADIQAQQAQAVADKKAADAKHGLLHRAWDWVNSPIGDNVLPDGMKTSDIIRAAAFEKMYGQAYIPGINDFDTKAAEHFTPEKPKMGVKKESNGVTHPFVASPETHAIRQGIKTFIAGAAKDTSDMAASFTSPLALGTLSLGELGKVPGAVGKIAKTVSPLVGTAFGLQGAGQAAIGGYHMAQQGATPENVQETIGGLGQAALGATAPVHTAADIGHSLQEAVRPVIENVGGQEIPVRPKGVVAESIAKSVDPDALNTATAKTTEAVQHGVGEVAKQAVGSGAETAVGDTDRFGLRAHVNDLKSKSVPAFQELDRLSGNAFSDAQEAASNSAKDFTTEGREKYKTALALQDEIIDQHRDELADAGYDVDEMKGNYRKQVALNKIAKQFDTATSPKADGGYDVSGQKLANVIDRIRRNPDNQFIKAGLTADHIDALGDLADTLRHEQVEPKFSGLTKLAGKAIAVVLSGGHGIHGLAEALTGESMAEKLGSKVMTRMFGEAMQSEPAARQLNEAIKSGDPANLAGWDNFKQVAQQLWTSERGEAGSPGSVKDETPAESADRFNQERGRAAVRPITPEVHPQPSGIPKTAKAQKALEGLVKIKPDAAEGVVTGSNQHGEGMEYHNDNSGSTNLQHTVTTTDADGNKIGELAAQDTAPKEVTVRSNQIYDKENRGAGRGPDQLRHLLSSVSDDTNRVKSDISTSGAARGAWEKLVKENPDAVTKKEYPGGQVQYSVDMDKWREGGQTGRGTGSRTIETNPAGTRAATAEEVYAGVRKGVKKAKGAVPAARKIL